MVGIRVLNVVGFISTSSLFQNVRRHAATPQEVGRPEACRVGGLIAVARRQLGFLFPAGYSSGVKGCKQFTRRKSLEGGNWHDDMGHNGPSVYTFPSSKEKGESAAKVFPPIPFPTTIGVTLSRNVHTQTRQ